jgi:hypothetical protein
MHTLLLVSSGNIHPHWRARRFLRQTITQIPQLTTREASSIESVLQYPPGQLAGVALYFHKQRISVQALDWLRLFVAGGGGLFAVHSASASFKEEPGYIELLGGRFDHHGAVADFTVEQVEPGEGIFTSLPPFTLRDELYRHEYDPANTVHFFTRVGDSREPVCWTRSFGEGRVCYLSLGHVARSMSLPPVQQIVRQGLAWACRLAEAVQP